jgi:acetylglutamate kinase
MSTSSDIENKQEFIPDPGLLNGLKGSVVLVKYGGNAMINTRAKKMVFDQIELLQNFGVKTVIVHGGGPVIKELLEQADIESDFIEGHRKTSREAMKYVEMALNGQVNGEIVKELNSRGLKAVGLSGKDASMVKAVKRFHELEMNGRIEKADLGYVGDVDSVDTELIDLLLDHQYLPVVAPIGIGSDGEDYNINADMFAGHVAGALSVAAFIAMTDVDGLMKNPDDPSTKIDSAGVEDIRSLMGKSIRGGMIPKVEACLIALDKGVKKAHIINGMKPDTLLNELLTNRNGGTTIVKESL